MLIKSIPQVFSFVFGDGDPNDGLEEKRWKMVFPFTFQKKMEIFLFKIAMDIYHKFTIAIMDF